MSKKETVQGTVLVAAVLCIVCSIVVSTAAVMLKPAQQANKTLDLKRNILMAAGLYEQGVSVDEQFKNVTTKVIDLETGKYTDAVDPLTYDQRKAAKDPSMSNDIDSESDIAKLSSVEKYAKVYLAKNKSGEQTVILPVRGYGLWSTLYGFIALEGDLNTVVGLGFYEHGETPGLGGEVDNPRWKKIWTGKKVYDESGSVALSVIKGTVDSSTPQAEHKVDGLSGATLTSRGVDNLIEYWLGDRGYAKFLTNLKNGEA